MPKRIELRVVEMARIECELEILRSRYASIKYWGGALKLYFFIALPILAVAMVAIAIFAGSRIYNLFVTNILLGGLTIGFVVVVTVLLWVARDRNTARRLRWAELASPHLFPFDLSGYGLWFNPNPLSEAQDIKDQIAIREKRLAELKGVSS